jgi:hypothetical protein
VLLQSLLSFPLVLKKVATVLISTWQLAVSMHQFQVITFSGAIDSSVSYATELETVENFALFPELVSLFQCNWY